MSLEWIDRLASLTVAIVYAAAIGVIVAVGTALLGGDPLHPSIGVAVGIALAWQYTAARAVPIRGTDPWGHLHCGAPGMDGHGNFRTCTRRPTHQGLHSARDSGGSPGGATRWWWR